MMSRFELGTYTDLQDNLRVRLMDIKSNRETLENAVYEPVGCGYALVAYLELPEEFDGGGLPEALSHPGCSFRSYEWSDPPESIDRR